MKGDHGTQVVNRFVITYEEHENQQGSHRISSETSRIRVLPDGHTTAKNRHRLISDALVACQDIGDVILALSDRALNVKLAGRTPDIDRVLILLHDGPLCGTDIPYMNRYAARIGELRNKGWPIESDRCRRHNHRGNQALYYLADE